jgi:hypothetical protein
MDFRSTFPRLALIAACLVARAHAAQAEDLTGFYIGGNGGLARIHSGQGRYLAQLEGESAGLGSLHFTHTSFDSNSAAWWADAGFMFAPYAGIEAEYLHLGELSDQVDGTFAATGGSSEPLMARRRLKSDGPALGLLFRLPLVDRVDITLRIADYYSRTTLTNSDSLGADSYSVSSQTVNGSSLLLGLGGAYWFGTRWAVRLDYLRIENAGRSSSVGRFDADTVSAGVSYAL